MSAEDPLWYKDAIIYHTHVKAFYDSNNDGIGDFKGLTQRLDYIRDLGATAIWVMPFYPSPLRDDGYDISEYQNVNPDYGTRRDFRNFVKKAHELGLKVIVELVINHTSEAHPWFQKARKAPKGSARRNYYVWSDDPNRYEGTRIIFTDTESSNWEWDKEAGQYYWHRFFSHQPDLNYDNPQVFKSVMRVMRFWLDAGVDGLRLDAIPYLVEREGTSNENLPETHEVLKRMRAELDANYDDRFFLAEANQWPEDVLPYFGDGDECHMAFHFPLMPRIYMAVAQEDRHPIVEIMEQTPEIPQNCQWAVFLRNHDELTLEMVTDRERDYMYEAYASDPRARINVGIRRRLAPLMENDRPRIELLNSLLLSMPGTPIIYYGDELGMGDNIFLGDRDTVRTPMQWTPDRNAGFSRADPARLYLPPIMDAVYGYQAVNVEAQSRDAGSLLNWMKRIISVRKAHSAFSRGTLQFLHPGNRKILAYLREHGDDSILCVANLSRSAQPVELDLSRYRERVPVELLGGSVFPPIGALPYLLTLPGHSFYWFRLAREAEAPSWHEDFPRPPEPPVIVVSGRDGHDAAEVVPALPSRQLSTLHRRALPDFLGSRRWFAAKGSELERAEISAHTPLGGRLLTIVRARLSGEEPQSYLLPLSVLWEDGDEDELQRLKPYTVARLRRHAKIGILYDALADEGFCREMAAAISDRRTLELEDGGRIEFTRSGSFEEISGGADLTNAYVRRFGVEQSNTSIVLEERLVLKAYRRLQRGTNPELEIGRYLTEHTDFRNTPPLAGAVEYISPEGEHTTLALLLGFITSQGDGWAYTLDHLGRRLQEQLLTSWSMEEEEAQEPDAADAFFTSLMETLGRRTGELHAAFASLTDEEAFSPEEAPAEEVRRWGEDVISELKQTFKMLRNRRKGLSDEVWAGVDDLLLRRKEAERRIKEASRTGEGALKCRYHGDYHLGQVLVTGNDFQIIDFEGEPARPLEERRARHSPLRDVAGMLRSFNYAARSALESALAESPGERADLEPEARRWEESVRAAFMEGYHAGTQGLGIYNQQERHIEALIDLFTIEKALYEIRYELDNRPTWVGIPVGGILQILNREDDR